MKNPKRKKIALTVAGSDSSGGAGIQADLKTYAALGVHGVCAITSVTAQNTQSVLQTYDIPSEMVAAQIDAVAADMDIDYAKTGMLSSPDVIRVVADKIKEYEIPLVVDPVMQAETGGTLMGDDALSVLIEVLLPLGEVVTPNAAEATTLSGIEVTDMESAEKAAPAIRKLGPEKIIITGGHLDCDDLVYDGAFRIISGEMIQGGAHGSGCTFSAAVTAELAKGRDIYAAAVTAKRFVEHAIKNSNQHIGSGNSPVDQVAQLVMDADRHHVHSNVQTALEILKGNGNFAALIPEVGSNIGMAVLNACSTQDIAAVEGRIHRANETNISAGCIRFGASNHVARIILAAMQFDPNVRAAMNIRYSPELLEICRSIELKIGGFSREDEPEGVDTMSWGVKHAIDEFGEVPDVIYDLGSVDKEAMIRLLGEDALMVAQLAVRIAEIT